MRINQKGGMEIVKIFFFFFLHLLSLDGGRTGLHNMVYERCHQGIQSSRESFFPRRENNNVLERLSELQFINAILLCSADCIHMTGHAKSC